MINNETRMLIEKNWDLCKAYCDCWSDEMAENFSRKLFGDIPYGFNGDRRMSLRNLDYKGQEMSVADCSTLFDLICPSYNNFESCIISKLLWDLPIKIIPAREGSVCLYIVGELSAPVVFRLKCDECDKQADGTLRLWWD